MNKDQRYRLKNRDLLLQKASAYHQKNKEEINAKKMRLYYENKDAILEKQKADRVECPICKIEYRRLYLKRHLLTRHKLDETTICQMINPKAKESHQRAMVEVQ